MSKGKLFDIEEAEWTEEEGGVRHVVFQASQLATVQYYEIPRGQAIAEICSPCEILVLCEQGICDYTINGKTYTVNDGCWCYIPADSTYSVRNHMGTTAINVRYYLPAWDALPESPKALDRGHNWG